MCVSVLWVPEDLGLYNQNCDCKPEVFALYHNTNLDLFFFVFLFGGNWSKAQMITLCARTCGSLLIIERCLKYIISSS